MNDYNLAKKKLESGITDYKDFFKENGNILEYGYCLILEGQLDKAEQVLRTIDSIRADWAVKLIPFMKGHVEILPTYFQIRNFLEIDINLLLLAKQTDSISYILGGADILYSVNCETYKYIARVMMNNGFYDIAKNYLKEARSNTYNDPELHFMCCQYYIKNGEFDKALQSIQECLNVLPEYYPAIKIKEALLKV